MLFAIGTSYGNVLEPCENAMRKHPTNTGMVYLVHPVQFNFLNVKDDFPVAFGFLLSTFDLENL